MTLCPDLRPLASRSLEPSASTRSISNEAHGGRLWTVARVPFIDMPPLMRMLPSGVMAMGPRSLWSLTANSEMPSRTVTTAASASS